MTEGGLGLSVRLVRHKHFGSKLTVSQENLLLYRHECFPGKYTTCKIHTKLHPGPNWCIFHILASEDIDDIIIFPLFTVVFCKQSLKNGERKNCLYKKKKMTGWLKI